MSIVSVVSSSYQDARTGLEQAIRLSGGLPLEDHDKIIIKINFCDARTADTGAVTHPSFLDALLAYLSENYSGMPIYVIESDATVVLADEFVRWLGYQEVLDKWGVPFVNLSKDDATVRRINGLYFSELPVPHIFDNAFYITQAKLKTNSLSQITCALKNQYGCMPEVIKSTYHTVLDEAIADVNLAYHPDFCIVDGILGHGGVQGPAFGTPIPAGIIIAGNDPVATDVVCARAMGIPPWLVGHIKTSIKVGIGSARHKLVGDPLPNVDFHASLLGMVVFKLGTKLKKRSDLKIRKQSRFGRRSMPGSNGHMHCHRATQMEGEIQ